MSDPISTGGQQVATVEHKPPPKATLTAGNLPRAIVPVDFEGAYRIANVVVEAALAPKTLNTVPKAMVAILHGLEVGLTPMNALQAIAVINGRPTIWGDGAIGLVRASGLLESMKEYFEGDGEDYKAVCIIKRKGSPDVVRGEFSWADARRAGLLGKEGPWQTYPKRMLQARARAWPLRDTFADVLKGLHIREEVEDMTETPAVPEAANPQPAAALAVPSAPIDDDEPDAAATESTTETASAAPQVAIEDAEQRPPLTDDERDWLHGLGGSFSGCEAIEELDAERERIMEPSRGKVSERAWQDAIDLFDEHKERIEHD